MEITGFFKRVSERKSTVVLLFLFFLVLGLFIFKDYGVGLDEEVTRTQNGLTNYNYIFHGDKQALLESAERFHGPAFEIVLFTMERVFHLAEIRTIHLMRHAMTFLLFYLSAVFLFLLSSNLFKKQWSALLAVGMYVLCPRIFGDAFYNAKDIAFLAMFTISLFTLHRFLENKTFRNGLIHALVCGLMIDVRITGIVIPMVTVVVFAIEYALAKREEAVSLLGFKGPLGIMITSDGKEFRPYMFPPYFLFLVSCFLFLLIQFVFIILFWPVLWIHPVSYFIEALKQMSHYPWTGDLLYLGRLVKSTNLPWHYAPVWMLVTIPVLYMALFFAGIVSLLWNSNKFLYVAAFLFLFPIVSIVVFHSVLYDGWRHLYFVYAPFVLLATSGAVCIYELWIEMEETGNHKRVIRKLAFTSVIGFSFLFTSITMFADHPLEQTFFNYPARKLLDPNRSFEMDYWALSYREAFADILKNDTSSQVHIRILMGGQLNTQILKSKDMDRIVFHGDEREADYNLLLFLGRYGRDGRYPIASLEYPVLKEIKNSSGNLLAICKGKRSQQQQVLIADMRDSAGIKNLKLTQYSRTIKYAVDSIGKNELVEFSVECQLYSPKPNPRVMLVFTVLREDTNCVKQTIYWEPEVFQSTLMKRNVWTNIRWNVNIPRNAIVGDSVSTYVWSPSNEPVWEKELKVRITRYSPK